MPCPAMQLADAHLCLIGQLGDGVVDVHQTRGHTHENGDCARGQSVECHQLGAQGCKWMMKKQSRVVMKTTWLLLAEGRQQSGDQGIETLLAWYGVRPQGRGDRLEAGEVGRQQGQWILGGIAFHGTDAQNSC